VKRGFDNLEGAFPLLLIGSVLVVYAGYLASEQSGSSHLPLWGLLGCVGAVIVGAGIYSTFLEPDALQPPATSVGRPSRRESPQARQVSGGTSSNRPPIEGQPIWWEGPPEVPQNAEATRPEPGRARTAALRRTDSALSGTRPGPVAPYTLTERRPRSSRYSLRELTKTLDELEAMVGAPPGASARAAQVSGAHTVTACVDCDRPFVGGRPSTRCPGCGRGLCGRCSELSRAEDGAVRCNECRARDS
jgi:hypothetical protein